MLGTVVGEDIAEVSLEVGPTPLGNGLLVVVKPGIITKVSPDVCES